MTIMPLWTVPCKVRDVFLLYRKVEELAFSIDKNNKLSQKPIKQIGKLCKRPSDSQSFIRCKNRLGDGGGKNWEIYEYISLSRFSCW